MNLYMYIVLMVIVMEILYIAYQYSFIDILFGSVIMILSICFDMEIKVFRNMT